MKNYRDHLKIKCAMKSIATVSASIAAVSLIAINGFGAVALTKVMSTAAFTFIVSGMYVMGVDHGYKDGLNDMLDDFLGNPKNSEKAEVFED